MNLANFSWQTRPTSGLPRATFGKLQKSSAKFRKHVRIDHGDVSGMWAACGHVGKRASGHMGGADAERVYQRQRSAGRAVSAPRARKSARAHTLAARSQTPTFSEKRQMFGAMPRFTMIFASSVKGRHARPAGRTFVEPRARMPRFTKDFALSMS